MNNAEYKLLNDIVGISYNIVSLYKDLMAIECTGNTNNDVYKYLYKSLVNYIDEEDSLYQKLYNNPHLAHKLCEYISSNFEYTDSKIYTDNELVFIRIYKTLSDCFLLTKEYIDDNLESFFNEASMKCYLSNIGIKDKLGLMYYLKYFKEDLDFSYLYFNDEYRKNNDLPVAVNTSLIKNKYYKLIFDKSLEKRIILNKESNINISYKFLYDIGICNKNLCDSMSYGYCNYFIINSIKNLLGINDDEYKKSKVLANRTMNQSMIRACLLFMDDESIMNVNSAFHEHVDNHIKNNKKNLGSQGIIIDCFKKTKKDRLKRRIIKLKHN